LKTALYPGTFDPITMGHLDLIKRGLHIFEHIIIAVAINPKKKPLFCLKKRLELIKEATKIFPKECITIEALTGLVVNYASQNNSVAIIRGLRAVSDFEFELQMALMNRRLNHNIETVFMMPSEEYSYLTSTIIKEVAYFGGSIKGLVPEVVEKELIELFKKEINKNNISI